MRVLGYLVLLSLIAYLIISKPIMLYKQEETKLQIDKNNIYIYSKSYCRYCSNAKKLFNEKSIVFKEIDITTDSNIHKKLKQATGQNTVPYIFIYGTFIGGYSQLKDLNDTQKLDKLLLQNNN